MPRGLDFSLQIIGDEEAIKDLDAIGRRMQNAQPAFELAMDILQAGEERHFRGLRGRYVDTGRLKASLTQESANGAIREAHDDHLEFGTSVYYGRFLRRKKKSAVLVLKPLERKAISKTVLGWMTGDDG